MFLNFFKNMKILNLDHKLHIFTSDEQGISFFKKNNLKYTLIRMPKLNNKLSEKYGSQKWNKINLLKGTIFSDLFNLYDEFIYSDPDVIWLKNGLEYLPNACKKDICFQSDSKYSDINNGSLNAGFFLARKSNFTQLLFQEWKSKCQEHEKNFDDQMILYKIVRKRKFIDNIQRLNRGVFANGIYDDYFNSENCRNLNATNLVTLHNNFVVGIENKISRAKKCSFWWV
jgi:hypothetical protein